MILWIGSPESRRLGRKRMTLSILVTILGIILQSLTATVLGFALVFMEMFLVWESDVRFEDVTYLVKNDCIEIEDGGSTVITYDRIIDVGARKGNTILLKTETGYYKLYHIKDCERVMDIIKSKVSLFVVADSFIQDTKEELLWKWNLVRYTTYLIRLRRKYSLAISIEILTTRTLRSLQIK